jgi:hypothetical protein
MASVFELPELPTSQRPTGLPAHKIGRLWKFTDADRHEERG